jgi:mRNA interferase RelE/StbE
MKSFTSEDRRRIMSKIETLQNNLAGDVKRLTNFTPEYRLRVGDYRVLFETVGDKVLLYRIKHRRDAYS